MKRIVLIVLLISGFTYTQAQRSKVVSAYNYAKPKYNELEKAMKAIDEAKDHPKTLDDPKTWYYRGMIYQKIYQDTSLTDLHEAPLVEAMKSFKKSLELDDRGRYEDDVLNLFNIALQQGLNQGIRQLRAEQPQKAFNTFKQLIESAKLEKTFNIEDIDKGIYFYAGIAAQQSENIEKANELFSKSIEMGHEVSRCYLLIAQNYKDQKDTVQYVQTLKTGLEKAEDNKNIMLLLVDYYTKSGKLEAALKYMKKAIEADPENVTLYFAMGNVHSEMGNPEKAQEAYDQAMKIDPDNVDVMYNMARLFYNKAAELRNQANDLPLEKEKEYKQLLKDAEKEFMRAAKYFERAHELAPKDKQVLKNLKTIYMQLRGKEGYTEKLEEVKKKLESL